jgi:hypothetical protein
LGFRPCSKEPFPTKTRPKCHSPRGGHKCLLWGHSPTARRGWSSDLGPAAHWVWQGRAGPPGIFPGLIQFRQPELLLFQADIPEILFPLAVLLPRKATHLRNQSQLGCRQDSTHYSYLFHNAAISSKLLVPRFMIHHSLVGATRESGMIPKVLREGSWAVGNSA